MTASPMRPGGARPLIVTTDDALLDALLRVVASAGAEAQVATGGAPLRRAYRDAPLVLLGADVLAGGMLPDLARRPGVVVVSAEELEPSGWAAAVELGAERVIRLPSDEAWLLARAAGAGRAAVREGPLAVVGGCCGGAGASTLAASVALAAATTGSVLLVDADPWGGGLDLVLGAERREGLRWPDLSQLRGRVSGEALLAALPAVGGVSVLAAGRGAVTDVPEEALLAAVGAARAEGWPVVVDVPRPGPGGRSTEALLAGADLLALVVPARVRAVWAARLLTEGDGPWSAAALVVRPLPGGLSVAEVAELVGRPVVAELRHDRAALSRGERGEPPLLSGRAPFGTAARRLVAELTGHPSPQRTAS